jgi:hypothetical protein
VKEILTHPSQIEKMGRRPRTRPKIKYPNKTRALNEVYRLQGEGIDGKERLQAYYDPDKRGWFVGHISKKEFYRGAMSSFLVLSCFVVLILVFH